MDDGSDWIRALAQASVRRARLRCVALPLWGASRAKHSKHSQTLRRKTIEDYPSRMRGSGRLGAAVMGAIFLIVIVALSLLPALNLMRDPVQACVPSERNVLVSTSTSAWPTGIECHLASSRSGETVDAHPTRSTKFVGYATWVGVVQLLLLVSALAIVLAAIWASTRSGPRTTTATPRRAAIR